MNFKARFGNHFVAVVASMAGGALAGGGIVLAFASIGPHLAPSSAPVAEISSPSPTDDPSPSPSPSPSEVPSPSPTVAPTSAPTAAPPVAPAATPSTAPPPPPPSPTCPTGKVFLNVSGSGRWDGTYTVPTICSTYTYRWTYGPAPATCKTWTLAFYPDVNGQGHEYVNGPASGGGSEVVRNPDRKVQSEVNLYNNECAVSWTVEVTAG